jgi:hypothetical protein
MSKMKFNELIENYALKNELDTAYLENYDFSDTKIGDLLPIFTEVLSHPNSSVVNDVLRFYSLGSVLKDFSLDSKLVLNPEEIEIQKLYKEEINTLSKKLFVYQFCMSLLEIRHCTEFKTLADKTEPTLHYDYYKVENGTQEEKANFKIQLEKEAKEYKAYVLEHYAYELKYDSEKVDLESFKKVYELGNVFYSSDAKNAISNPKKIIEVLSQDEYKNLTLKEFVISWKHIFYRGDFDYSKGGTSWVKINDELKKLITGKLNAEEYIDQVLYFRTRNGKQFNTGFMFDEGMSRRYVSTELNDQMYRRKSLISDIQVCLSMAKNNQVLSVLSHDFKKFGVTIDNFPEHFQKLKEDKIINLDEGVAFDEEGLNNVHSLVKMNIDSLSKVVEEFQKNNAELINKIKEVTPNKLPPVNIRHILKDTYDSDDSAFYTPSEYRDFYKIIDYSLNYKAGLKKEDKKEIAKFSKNLPLDFSYYNTKTLPVEFNTNIGIKGLGIMKLKELEIPSPDTFIFPSPREMLSEDNKTTWIKSFKVALNTMVDNINKNEPTLYSVGTSNQIKKSTILNVGIDTSNYEFFCQKMGQDKANECINNFMTTFCRVNFKKEVSFSNDLPKALFQFRSVLNLHGIPQDFDNMFPLNLRQQYRLSLECIDKINLDERTDILTHNIESQKNHDKDPKNKLDFKEINPNVIVMQKMLYGNKNEHSFVGNICSRDVNMGSAVLVGDCFEQSQAVNVSSNKNNSIKEFKKLNPTHYKALAKYSTQLEKATGKIQKINFTIEDNQLYVTEAYPIKSSAVAQGHLNYELYQSGLMSHEELLSSLPMESFLPYSKNTKCCEDFGFKTKDFNTSVQHLAKKVITGCDIDIQKLEKKFFATLNVESDFWIKKHGKMQYKYNETHVQDMNWEQRGALLVVKAYQDKCLKLQPNLPNNEIPASKIVANIENLKNIEEKTVIKNENYKVSF